MQFGAADHQDEQDASLDVVAWSLFWRFYFPSLVLVLISGVVVELLLSLLVSIFSGQGLGVSFFVNLTLLSGIQAIVGSFVAFAVFRLVLEDRLGKSVRGLALVLQKMPISTDTQGS